MTTEERDINGIPHAITYTLTEGGKGVHTLPSGDPGYPDDPDEIEIHKVVRCWGEVDVTEEMREDAYEVIAKL